MTSEPLDSGNGRPRGATLGAATQGLGSGVDLVGANGRAETPESLGFRPHSCFACGQLNAAGIRLALNIEPSRCWTELALDRRFEGWEGIVHGGIVSAILDEVMVWSLIRHDSWGVTAKLEVQFRRPVEVGRRIRAEGWLTEIRRRTERTAGRLLDAETGEELATAHALYMVASEAKKRELKKRYLHAAATAHNATPGEVDA